MGEVINLRQVRKSKARAEADARAQKNRAKFGRTKAEKDAEKKSEALSERRLEAHRRETADDEPGQ